MQGPWEMWKKAFQAWEDATARWLEQGLRSPLVLEPAGALLTKTMQTKSKADDLLARWWRFNGLPTRREQERMMHVVNQLQSQLHDLEERLEQVAEDRSADR